MKRIFLMVLSMSALVPACLFAADGQILVNQATVMAAGGFPYNITQPGSYKLSGNLTVPNASTTAILIAADNVTVDLNGFSILGPTVCVLSFPATCSPVGPGIGIEGGSHRSITVMNGSVRGMGAVGIHLVGGGGYVEKVHADSNGTFGINVAGTAIGNTVTGNGSSGISASGSVIGNTASENSSYGIAVMGTATGNTVTGNSFGLFASCPSVLANNTVDSGFMLAGTQGTCALANNATF